MEHIHKGRTLSIGFFILFLILPSVIASNATYGKSTVSFYVPSNVTVSTVQIEKCYEVVKIGDWTLCKTADNRFILVISTASAVTSGICLFAFPRRKKSMVYDDMKKIIELMSLNKGGGNI